jgi:hypothetical protein
MSGTSTRMLIAESKSMYDEIDQLDEALAHLARSLRSSDMMLACIQLAEFALKLDRIMRSEERVLSLAYQQMDRTARHPLMMVKSEHASLRRLISLIASAIDRADERRGLEVIGKLRSVLMVHVAKEEALHPLMQHDA